MAPEEADVRKVGFTTAEWKAFLFSNEAIDPLKLQHARAVIVEIGKYNSKLASDNGLLDWTLRKVGAVYSHYTLEGESLTQDDKIKLLELRNGWSNQQAKEHLDSVLTDRQLEEEIRRRASKPK